MIPVFLRADKRWMGYLLLTTAKIPVWSFSGMLSMVQLLLVQSLIFLEEIEKISQI